MLARTQIAREHHRLGGRRHRDDHVAGQPPPPCSLSPAQLVGQRLSGARVASVAAHPSLIAQLSQAAPCPGPVHTAADDPDGAGPRRRQHLRRNRRRRPVRSDVTAAQSTIATSAPLAASDTSSAPATTGSPRCGLPGNEVTHFSSASPSPRAGIARKSPCGGAST